MNGDNRIPSNLAGMPVDKRKTPEHALWFAVLEMCVIDAKRASINDVRLEALLRHMESPWIKYICDMIDLEYDFFMEKFKQVIDETSKRRRAYRSKRERVYRRIYPLPPKRGRGRPRKSIYDKPKKKWTKKRSKRTLGRLRKGGRG